MLTSEITPLILTFNEEANLERTLQGLSWAKQILIVDSFSSDDTLAIAGRFPAVKVIQRAFDHFSDQCNFGLSHIQTPWVLSLDADYVCDQALAAELAELDAKLHGYEVSFRYAIYGHPLRATLYPPRVVLYRREQARYQPDGHAHRVHVSGEIGRLRTPIVHDDWKPLDVWFKAQFKYAQAEADKLEQTPSNHLGWKDRLRKKLCLAPILTPVYCLVLRGLLLDGWRGLFYAFQRTLAELLLSLTLLDRKIRKRDG